MATQAFTMPPGVDIQITKQGGAFVVTGKDAPTLHQKLLGMPQEARDLEVGPLHSGMFTLKKMPAAQLAT